MFQECGPSTKPWAGSVLEGVSLLWNGLISFFAFWVLHSSIFSKNMIN